MREALIDILRDVAFKDGIIASFSETIPPDKKTELIRMANDVKDDVAAQCRPSSLLETFWLKLEAEYTTGTVAITNNKVDCVGTSTVITAAMVDRKIQIGSDPTVYEIATRTSDTVFTINRPFLGTTETAGAIQILKDIYDVPPHIWKFIALHDDENGPRVRERTSAHLNLYYPDPFDYQGADGNTVLYAYEGSYEDNDTFAVATAPSTSTATLTPAPSTLVTDYDDYYRGWMWYNANRTKTVRVKSYAKATALFTMDVAITDQAVADSITLRKEVERIKVRNVPTDAVYLRGIGMSAPTRLTNDQDVDYELPVYYSSMILREGIRFYYSDAYETDPAKRAIRRASYEQLKKRLKEDDKDAPNRTYGFGQSRMRSIGDNPFQGGGWPADQG